MLARGKMDAAGISVGALPRPIPGRVRSIIWTGAGRGAKNFDTPAGGGVERRGMPHRRLVLEFFARGGWFRPIAYRQRIAFGKLSADGDFRREQATKEVDRPINQVIETGGNVVAEPLELVVQAWKKFCCDAARTVFPTCHDKLRSLFRAQILK
jgi:hypothetical protein